MNAAVNSQWCELTPTSRPAAACVHATAAASSHGRMGALCDGHFVMVKTAPPGPVVVVCEGFNHWFAHWQSTCPVTKASVDKFAASVCLGGSYTSMKVRGLGNNWIPE